MRDERVTARLVIVIFSGVFFSDAKTDTDFRCNYGRVDLVERHRDKERGRGRADDGCWATSPSLLLCMQRETAGPAQRCLVWFERRTDAICAAVLHDACAPCGVH